LKLKLKEMELKLKSTPKMAERAFRLYEEPNELESNDESDND
jgi:hypothetical protein